MLLNYGLFIFDCVEVADAFSVLNEFFSEIFFDLLQLFLLIIHVLVFNINFAPYHSDLIVTNFLLPVKVVQDFLSLIEFRLLFRLFLLLRL